MKKIFQASVLLFAAGLLTACSTPQASKSNESTSQSTTEVSTTEEEEAVTIFTATVESVTQLEDQSASTQILLKEVKAVDDPEEVTMSFQDGVALNVEAKTLDFEVKEGDKVKVSLHHPAVMTMSLPPQIPGNSIISVEQVK